MDKKKLIDTINTIEVPRNYTMRAMDPGAIWSAANGDWYRAITYGFRYGFLKGQHAERARMKNLRGGRSA